MPAHTTACSAAAVSAAWSLALKVSTCEPSGRLAAGTSSAVPTGSAAALEYHLKNSGTGAGVSRAAVRRSTPLPASRVWSAGLTMRSWSAGMVVACLTARWR